MFFRTLFRLILVVCSVCLIGFCTMVTAAQNVTVDVAQRAAEYYGELLFEKDLRICGSELMIWPWGEPAVFVFTLADEDDFALPADVTADNIFIQGAWLVANSQEAEGYRMMAQPEKYKTVVVGATVDMPSFIKAYAGLPEHVLTLAAMEVPIVAPVWIYGGLFHSFIASKPELGLTEVTEIHSRLKVRLEELGREKAGAIPPEAFAWEWEPFLYHDRPVISPANPYQTHITGFKEGKHVLPVKEAVMSTSAGCFPAALVNCLLYQKQRKQISTKKGPLKLVEWAGICCRTNPKSGGTKSVWGPKGARILLRGMGYESECTLHRRPANPKSFTNTYCDEIHKKNPCELGGGSGIFRLHSTVGIGYWKLGSQVWICVHDGNPTSTETVFVKYQGFPQGEMMFPRDMTTIDPGKKKVFPKAKPAFIDPPKKEVLLKLRQKCWAWKFKVKSKNDVELESYGYEASFFDAKGRRWSRQLKTYFYPYGIKGKWNYPYPDYRRGKVVTTYYLIDDNGHLLKKKRTQRMEHILGKWRTTVNWEEVGSGTCIDEVKINGRWLTQGYGDNGPWGLENDRTVWFECVMGVRPIYTGKVKANYKEMSGSAKTREKYDGKIIKGSWTMVRIDEVP